MCLSQILRPWPIFGFGSINHNSYNGNMTDDRITESYDINYLQWCKNELWDPINFPFSPLCTLCTLVISLW